MVAVSTGRETREGYMRADVLHSYAPMITNKDGIEEGKDAWEQLSKKLGQILPVRQEFSPNLRHSDFRATRYSMVITSNLTANYLLLCHVCIDCFEICLNLFLFRFMLQCIIHEIFINSYIRKACDISLSPARPPSNTVRLLLFKLSGLTN